MRGGTLTFGDEMVVEGGEFAFRPLTGPIEQFIISPAFANAHSHLEYRGMQGKITATEYWPWIRELTALKQTELPDEVKEACLVAAKENLATGVGWIGEHADRPYSAAALASVGIGGVLFQELITFFERDNRAEKWSAVLSKRADAGQLFDGPAHLAAHAYQTVDLDSLREIGASRAPFSMHVAETAFESELTKFGKGPIAEFYARFGFEPPISGKRLIPTLQDLGLVRAGAQFVHCCDVDDSDIEAMASTGVSVAHCPRSNTNLGCPTAPVRRMLESGIPVGLGMDSAASSGPIDMFAEMRSALDVSRALGEPLSAEQVWAMATDLGRRSVPGTRSDGMKFITVRCDDPADLADVIASASPTDVSHVSMSG